MTLLRFSSFCDLNCGTPTDLQFKIANMPILDAMKVLLNIDFEPFESMYDGFMEPYTRSGNFGFSCAQDFDTDGFDILFAFNDDDICATEAIKIINTLSKYVLKFFPGEYRSINNQ